MWYIYLLSAQFLRLFYLDLDYFSLPGRPDFNFGKVASAPFRLAILSPLIRVTPMRNNSLFLISTPAFRQAF